MFNILGSINWYDRSRFKNHCIQFFWFGSWFWLLSGLANIVSNSDNDSVINIRDQGSFHCCVLVEMNVWLIRTKRNALIDTFDMNDAFCFIIWYKWLCNMYILLYYAQILFGEYTLNNSRDLIGNALFTFASTGFPQVFKTVLEKWVHTPNANKILC